MIKNDTQLRRAESSLQQLLNDLDQLRANYSGAQLQYWSEPLLHQINQLRQQMSQYLELKQMSLGQAVQGPLKRPVLLESIGELLSKLRIAAGLTQEEMGTKLGWQQPNLSRFESENYNSQTIAKISEYLDALGVFLHVVPSMSETPSERAPLGTLISRPSGMPINFIVWDEASTTSAPLWPIPASPASTSDFSPSTVAISKQART